MIGIIAGILGCAVLFAVYGVLGLRASREAAACDACPLVGNCSTKQRQTFHERPRASDTPVGSRHAPSNCDY